MRSDSGRVQIIPKWAVGGRWLRCRQLRVRDTDPRASACRVQFRPIDVPITLRQHRRRLEPAQHKRETAPGLAGQ